MASNTDTSLSDLREQIERAAYPDSRSDRNRGIARAFGKALGLQEDSDVDIDIEEITEVLGEGFVADRYEIPIYARKALLLLDSLESTADAESVQ